MAKVIVEITYHRYVLSSVLFIFLNIKNKIKKFVLKMQY